MSVAAIGQHRKGALTDTAQRYTVSQLLELPPKKLPHNFILEAESGAAPQAELDRLKSSYAKKYGVTLGWGVELSADTARTNLVFTSEHSAKPEITKKRNEPNQPEIKLGSNGITVDCITQVLQQIANEELGLPADASEASRSSRKTELIYKLDENIRPDRASEILNARLYGLDESLTARELERQVNHPAQKRWVEILQIAPDSSQADIMQAQQEQMDRFSAGKEGQENGLPDEASAEEVKELESDWLLRRLQLQQDCQI